MMTDGQFTAIRFVQGVGVGKGQKMYLFSAPAKWLIDRTKIDQWDPELSDANSGAQGYQRDLSNSHLKSIGRYLGGTIRSSNTTDQLPVFPTSVLLSVRSDVQFRPHNGSAQSNPWVTAGQLSLIPSQDVYIIDGQHRIKGLEKFINESGLEESEQFWNYHLPVTLMVCEDKLQELSHFLIINREAKSVRTDLAERLLDLVHAEDPSLIRDAKLRDKASDTARGLRVVRYLETTPDQPWVGRIAKPNERRKGEKTASESQLSKSFRHITRSMPLGWDIDKICVYVADFWRALEQLLPEAFESPRNYAIQRAVGFGALHQLLPNLVSAYTDKDSLVSLFEGTEPYFTEAEYWEKGGEASQYSSEGGYKKHADRIKMALQEGYDG